MDYIKEYQLDDLYVRFTQKQFEPELQEINIINDGFNLICHWILKGSYHGSPEDIEAWQDEPVELRLRRADGRYYKQGKIVQSDVLDGHDGLWAFQLTVKPNLASLQHTKNDEYFTNTSLKSLFRQLLVNHHIENILFKFDDIIHPFELQYDQSDHDLFTTLLTQYGLHYYFEVDKCDSPLVITEELPTFKKHRLTESEPHYMLHGKVCAFEITKKQQATPSNVLLQAEDANNKNLLYESVGNTEKSAHEQTDMMRHHFHDLYATQNQLELDKQAFQLLNQLHWQQNIIYFSMPLTQVLPGDEVTLCDTHDPRHAGTYYVISIDSYFKRWFEEGGEHSASYMRVTAIPSKSVLKPIHQKLAQQFLNAPLKPNYKTAQPPLLLGTIYGSPTEQARYQGAYEVELAINRDKNTPEIRSLQNYTGPTKAETYGFDFPLHGRADVILTTENNCPQRLVILGSYSHKEQASIINANNPMQHTIQTNHGLGMCWDNKDNSLSLFDSDAQNKLKLSAFNKKNDITLDAQKGEIQTTAFKSINQSISNTAKFSAKEIIKNIGTEYSFSSKKYYVNAKKKITYQSSHTLIKTSLFDLKTKKLKVNSKNISSMVSSQKLNIKSKKIIIDAKKSIQLHASKHLNTNIGTTRLNFTKAGNINTNKKIELHAKKIKKHQLTLLSCGGSTQFEVEDFFQQQYAALNNKEHFRQRQKEQRKNYIENAYTQEAFRIHHDLVSENSSYLKYKSYMEDHGLFGSLFGVSSIPGTIKEIYSQSKGDFKSSVNAIQEISFIKNGGWNSTRDLHVEYLKNGTIAKYKYYQKNNGLINEGEAILEGTSAARAAIAESTYFRTTLTTGLKGAVKFGVPLAVAGDILECGMDTYAGTPNGICSSKTVFAKNLALDVPKGIVSGAAGAVSTAAASGLLGLEAGSLGGPVGAAGGLVIGIVGAYLAGAGVEYIYVKNKIR